jgi:hypothetical protein
MSEDIIITCVFSVRKEVLGVTLVESLASYYLHKFLMNDEKLIDGQKKIRME